MMSMADEILSKTAIQAEGLINKSASQVDFLLKKSGKTRGSSVGALRDVGLDMVSSVQAEVKSRRSRRSSAAQDGGMRRSPAQAVLRRSSSVAGF